MHDNDNSQEEIRLMALLFHLTLLEAGWENFKEYLQQPDNAGAIVPAPPKLLESHLRHLVDVIGKGQKTIDDALVVHPEIEDDADRKLFQDMIECGQISLVSMRQMKQNHEQALLCFRATGVKTPINQIIR